MELVVFQACDIPRMHPSVSSRHSSKPLELSAIVRNIPWSIIKGHLGSVNTTQECRGASVWKRIIEIVYGDCPPLCSENYSPSIYLLTAWSGSWGCWSGARQSWDDRQEYTQLIARHTPHSLTHTPKGNFKSSVNLFLWLKKILKVQKIKTNSKIQKIVSKWT